MKGSFLLFFLLYSLAYTDWITIPYSMLKYSHAIGSRSHHMTLEETNQSLWRVSDYKLARFRHLHGDPEVHTAEGSNTTKPTKINVLINARYCRKLSFLNCWFKSWSRLLSKFTKGHFHCGVLYAKTYTIGTTTHCQHQSSWGFHFLNLRQLDGGEWLWHTPVALLLEKQFLVPGG